MTRGIFLIIMMGLTGPAHAQASEDLKCFSAALDMSKLAERVAPESRYSFLPVQAFYLGRLSIIEPRTDWIWVASTSESHVSFAEARPILEACSDRMAKLTHVSAK